MLFISLIFVVSFFVLSYLWMLLFWFSLNFLNKILFQNEDLPCVMYGSRVTRLLCIPSKVQRGSIQVSFTRVMWPPVILSICLVKAAFGCFANIQPKNKKIVSVALNLMLHINNLTISYNRTIGFPHSL